MAQSTIEWTEVTWNPVTGCTKVSAGCKFCYAERMAKRLQAMGLPQYADGFKLTLQPHTLQQPYQWKKPRLVFVNSMSDLFHPDVPLDYVQSVFEVMNNTAHTYQVLTKRADRLLELSSHLNWTKNIWMGVSVEDERVVDRVKTLSKTGAFIKFASVEPLIGPIKRLHAELLDWVIVGGESGPGARPMKAEWVKAIYEECLDTETPFFFKQWGKKANNPDPGDLTIAKSHPAHAKGGCLLDGQFERAMPRAA